VTDSDDAFIAWRPAGHQVTPGRTGRVLIFTWENDDNCAVTLGRIGEPARLPVAALSHDDHGWAGMEAMRDSLVTLAGYLQVEVVVEGTPGIQRRS
jgi:hypothetical protein